jgi:hypothetical protein
MMNSIDEIERLLGQTPLPNLLNGEHREQLKRQLLEGTALQPTERRTFMSVFGRMPPILKLAAALLAAAILVGSGWAGEKIYRTLTETWISVILDDPPSEPWTLPDGRTFHVQTAGGSGASVSSDDPKAIETVRRRFEEMKGLIAKKKYTFLRTQHLPSDKEKRYVYRFTLADGSPYDADFFMPLDNVASWDDYRRKEVEHNRKRRERIGKAIAAGKFRLIDVDVIRVHVCRDAGSNEKIQVQHYVGHGEEIACISPFDREATTELETSWQDHLKAVREGKREILDFETTTSYEYEVILEDGSKTIFSYCGGEPLKKP